LVSSDYLIITTYQTLSGYLNEFNHIFDCNISVMISTHLFKI